MSTFEQTAFRLRNDNGGLLNSSGATWMAPLNTNRTLLAGTVFRIRFAITIVDFFSDSTFHPNLVCSLNQGSYTEPGLSGSSSAIRFFTSPYTTHNAIIASPSELHSCSGISGRFCVRNTDISSVVFGATTDGTVCADYEWCLQLHPDLVTEGDTIDFRMRNTTTNLNYTVTPRITATYITSGTMVSLETQPDNAAIVYAEPSIISENIVSDTASSVVSSWDITPDYNTA